MQSIAYLPNDLLFSICKEWIASWHDLCSLDQAVCQRSQRISLLEALTVGDLSPSWLSFQANAIKYVTSRSISYDSLHLFNDESMFLWKETCNKFTCLTNIKLDGLEAATFAEVLQAVSLCSSLRCMEIDMKASHRERCHLPTPFLLSFPGLQTLKLSNIQGLGNEDLLMIVRSMPSLCALSILSCHQVTGNGILQALQASPSSSLTSLTTFYIHMATYHHREAVLEAAPTEVVDVLVSNLDDVHFTSTSTSQTENQYMHNKNSNKKNNKHKRGITHLEIQDMHLDNGYYRQLLSFSSHPGGLLSFIVPNAQVTLKQLYLLLDHPGHITRNLTTLKIGQCNYLTAIERGEFFVKLTQRCPNLTTLAIQYRSFSYSTAITNSGYNYSSLPNASTYVFQNIWSPFLRQFGQQLISLDCCDLISYFDQLLIAIGEYCYQKLEVLTIKYTPYVTCYGIEKMLETMHEKLGLLAASYNDNNHSNDSDSVAGRLPFKLVLIGLAMIKKEDVERMYQRVKKEWTCLTVKLVSDYNVIM